MFEIPPMLKQQAIKALFNLIQPYKLKPTDQFRLADDITILYYYTEVVQRNDIKNEF